MPKKVAVTVFLLLSLSLSFYSPALADWTELLQYFANASPGQDPGEPDTIYLVCSELTSTKQVIQVRFKTDNVGRNDSIQGAYIPMIVHVDKPYVILDTTHSTTFASTALSNWSNPELAIGTNSGNPSIFPMKLVVGGADLGQTLHLLAHGDFLLANLIFYTVEPTNICIDTTSQVLTGIPLSMTTSYAIEYTPQWYPACCGPTVPTLSEWGLIIFGVLLLSGVVFFLKRGRRAYSR